ncbi:MAG: DMT family transporter [Pseudomonadota bacterium]
MGDRRSPSGREDRRLLGIFLALAAFAGFCGIDVSAKWLAEAGMPITQIVFVRYLVHLALVVAVAAPTLGLGFLRANRPRDVALRGVFLLIGTALNFWAVRHLPLTVTSAIFFTSPLFVCLLSIPLLGERIGSRRWTAIIVGFLGVLIVIRPWSADAHWAMFLSLGATLGGALYLVYTRKLAGADSAATQQFYAALLCTLVAAPLATLDWSWPADRAGWSAFALIGVFGWAGHQLVTVAHRYAPASTLAPFVYSQIVYMTVAGWVLFGDAPDIWVGLGAAVVMASGLYIWVRERSQAQAASPG